MFQKLIADYYKQQKNTNQLEHINIFSKAIQDIKQELKQNDPKTRANALLKLYFLKFNNQDIQWSNFEILNILGYPEQDLKQIAYGLASQQFPHDSQTQFMATNIFQKDLKQNSVAIQSLSLNCLGNIIDRNINIEIFKQLFNLTQHSKTLIRKKSVVCVGIFMSHFQELIPNNLEVMMKQMQNEKSANVLICYVNFMDIIISKHPGLFPIILKSSFQMITNLQNNWLIIKMLHLFDKMIGLDIRLLKKLHDPLFKMLKQTNSKSVEYEINKIVIKYFKDHDMIYTYSLQNIKKFIESNDKNLKILGLKILPIALKNDTNMINEFSDFLVESFRTTDIQIKKTVLQIFQQYITKEIYQEIVIQLLQQLDRFGNQEFKNYMIKTVLDISQQNNYQIIEDIYLFLNTIMSSIIKHVNTEQNATICSNIIKELFMKIDQIKPNIISYSLLVFETLIQYNKSKFKNMNNDIQFIYDCGINKDKFNQMQSLYKVQGIVVQQLMILASEFCQHEQQMNVVLQFLQQIIDKQFRNNYQNQSLSIQICYFKILMHYISVNKQNGNLDKNQNVCFLIQGFTNLFKTQQLLPQIFCKILGLDDNKQVTLDHVNNSYSKLECFIDFYKNNKIQAFHQDSQKLVYQKYEKKKIKFVIGEQELEIIKNSRKISQKNKEEENQNEQVEQVQQQQEQQENEQQKNDVDDQKLEQAQIEDMRKIFDNKQESKFELKKDVLPEGIDINQIQNNEQKEKVEIFWRQ